MLVYHHIDADGYCAAYWVHKFFTSIPKENFIPINYGTFKDEDIINQIKEDKDNKIFIVDFSFEPELLKHIIDTYNTEVIWIDHHKTSIEKYEKANIPPYYIPGFRQNGIAGCELTYRYLYRFMNDKPIISNNQIPWFTRYIGDYDVWKFEFGDDTRYFKLGLDAHGLENPCSEFWDSLLNINEVSKLIEKGKIITEYRDSLGKLAMKSGFEKELFGYKVFCCNLLFRGSNYFDSIIDNYDAVCSYNYDGKSNTWQYHFYSETIDTTIISLGLKNIWGDDVLSAGGHKGASGAIAKINLLNI